MPFLTVIIETEPKFLIATILYDSVKEKNDSKRRVAVFSVWNRKYYLKSFLRDIFFSLSFAITYAKEQIISHDHKSQQSQNNTLATAISKSSCVTCTRRSLNAYIPASVHTALISAPLAPGNFSAIFARSIPLIRFILRDCKQLSVCLNSDFHGQFSHESWEYLHELSRSDLGTRSYGRCGLNNKILISTPSLRPNSEPKC